MSKKIIHPPVTVHVLNTVTGAEYEVLGEQWGGESKRGVQRHMDVPLGLDNRNNDGLAVFVIDEDGISWRRVNQILKHQEKYIVTILSGELS